jgi:hypothetical protein
MTPHYAAERLGDKGLRPRLSRLVSPALEPASLTFPRAVQCQRALANTNAYRGALRLSYSILLGIYYATYLDPIAATDQNDRPCDVQSVAAEYVVLLLDPAVSEQHDGVLVDADNLV